MRTGITVSITDKACVVVHDEGEEQRRTRYQRVWDEGEENWGPWEAGVYDLRPGFDTGVPTSRTLATRSKLRDALNAFLDAAETFETVTPR